jgi:DNA-binding MarR family transcriptional regulator
LRQLLTGFTFDLVKHLEPSEQPMQSGERNVVAAAITADLSNEFLSSARVFAWSVREVIERTVLREVSGDNLTFSQLKLLYLVAHTDVLTIGDAAAFLGVTCGAAGKTVDKLVRRRLLRRIAPEEDRRSFRLSLTETSRKLMEAYEVARDHRAKMALQQFPPEELRRTSDLLDRLAGAIVSGSSHPDAVCMQCEIYFREHCRFADYGRRNCFYQRHKMRDPKSLHDRGSAEGKVD